MKSIKGFKTFDNLTLKYIEYQPDLPTKAVLIIIHGISGATLDDYDPLAEKLNENQIKVLVPYMRGYPPSEGVRGDVKSFEVYFRDIEFFYHKVALEEGDKPIFVLGHSLGGAIATHMAARNLEKVRGIILVNPAYKTKGKYKFPITKILNVLIKLIFAPSKPSIDTWMDPNLIPHEEDRKEAMEKENDPNIVHVYSPRFLWNANKLTKAVPKMAEKADKPLLLIYGELDPSIDPVGHREIYSNWKSGDKFIYEVKGGGHGKHVLYWSSDVILDWIKKHI